MASEIINQSNGKCDLVSWREVIRENFPDLLIAAELALCLPAQLQLRDIRNCFALVLTGQSSIGKTIVIDFFRGINEISYLSDSFTPSSFLSHAAKISKKNLGEIDLLPRIRRKVMLVPDLAPLFSLREDDLVRSLGVLTRVLDGQGLSTDSGQHGRRSLEGDYLFMMLAATTPVTRRVWKAMSTLGPRLFFYWLPKKDKGVEELAQQNRDINWSDKVDLCRGATRKLLMRRKEQYPEGISWDKSGDSMEHLKAIAQMARLLSRLRAKIEMEDDGEKRECCAFEAPDRINQCLYNLARAHAVLDGRQQLIEEDLFWPLQIALNSAPEQRVQLLSGLLTHEGAIRTSEVGSLLGITTPALHTHMGRMCTIGLCEESKINGENAIRLKEEFRWFLGDECLQILYSATSEKLKGALSESDLVPPLAPSPC
ncbi:MAG: Uncharacterized protein Greene041662_366 [Candidatus Peregrinibacteria bacterium Greene0416_62]|nr:MAG: Uncharacterized protein Greene041662_366 [Candidatus Peregrinibacteria bacterium Greene0416_62]TSC99127.1 MAG: Uncharacterized protein Greene101449_703 [Candidatus Peregrinibacteria bacterium Greene1014_49]